MTRTNNTSNKSQEQAKGIQTEMVAMTSAPKKSYDNEKRIVIFQNNQRTEAKHPVMRGNFVLNGKTYNISLWTKKFTKDGKDEFYLQGQISEDEQNSNATTDLSQFMDKSQADM